MAYSDDHIALAAEYALGTLDAEERALVEAMMSVDKEFTVMVEASFRTKPDMVCADGAGTALVLPSAPVSFLVALTAS